MKKFENKQNSPTSGQPSTQYHRRSQYPPPEGPPPQLGYSNNPDVQQQQYAPCLRQYAPPPGPPPPVQSARLASSEGGEDALSALKRYDTVFVVDDSESMEMFWDETRNALVGAVEKAIQYDNDAQAVRELFRRVEPRRSTPTALALKAVLDPYMQKLEAGKSSGGPKPKPLNLICLTDGVPDRDQDPEPVIVEVAKRLDAGRFPLFQVGIHFIQIGNDDQAAEALQRLDDDLKVAHGIRDMVDCTSFQASNGQINAEFLLKALLGGLNRRIDKSG